MSHPFTTRRRSFIIYSIIWILLAVVIIIILHFNGGFSLAIAATDALLTSLLFGLFGLVAWYPTSYIPFRKEAPVYSILAHVVAGTVVIAAWIFITLGLLSVIFNSIDLYIDYLENSIFWRVIIGIMAYLVLVLIYYLVSYARTLREKAQAEEKLKTLVKESELNMLKSQINPHFLFNSLNSISSLILSEPDEAREMIIRLSEFLRYSLKHRENEFVTLEEELGRMKDYLSIEQVRFGDKLRFSLDAADACKKLKVPTMIMQPLMENAIKHGVYESLEPVSIQLKCDIKDEHLYLELQNDYDPDQPTSPGTGVGLQNVSERVRLAYDGKGRVTRNSSDGKFKITLILPI